MMKDSISLVRRLLGYLFFQFGSKGCGLALVRHFTDGELPVRNSVLFGRDGSSLIESSRTRVSVRDVSLYQVSS